MTRGLALALLLSSALAFGKPKATAVEVKAVMAVKLPYVTTYPANRRPKSKGELRVGVIGSDKVAEEIFKAAAKDKARREAAARAAKKKGESPAPRRSISVKRYTDPKKARKCHVLYVVPTKKLPLATVLAALGDAPVLVVGSSPRFAHDGGMIRLRTQRGKIRFDFNLRTTKRCGLRLNPKVLRMGTVVAR